MSFIYNLAIYLLSAAIWIVSVFSSKVRHMAHGRRGVIRRARKEVTGDNVVWVHCASLGEFEQGRSVIEALKASDSTTKIVLTFFSSSGYQVRKNYSGADYIYYLPSDTRRNARRFVAAIKPRIAIFVKYEYWYNYLNELHKQGAKSYVISAIFRPTMRFFRTSGGFFRSMLRLLDHLFVQNEESIKLLASIGITNATVSGDTRFDRVSDIVNKAPHLPIVEQFATGARVVVCGSTWSADLDLLLPLMSEHPELKFIVAPHQPTEAEIERFITMSERPTTRYTQKANPEATLMVIDCVGILSGVYAYGEVAYIGGGFGAGIHNILEASTWGLPVIFGPRYHKFAEARELIDRGGAFSVSTYSQISETLKHILEHQSEISEIASRYVKSNVGATKAILDKIQNTNI